MKKEVKEVVKVLEELRVVVKKVLSDNGKGQLKFK